MPEMKKVVDLVAQEHLNVKVMIGGAPVNQDYCNEIGADIIQMMPLVQVKLLMQSWEVRYVN